MKQLLEHQPDHAPDQLLVPQPEPISGRSPHFQFIPRLFTTATRLCVSHFKLIYESAYGSQFSVSVWQTASFLPISVIIGGYVMYVHLGERSRNELALSKSNFDIIYSIICRN